jgi:iron complex outermembrane recepter protein
MVCLFGSLRLPAQDLPDTVKVLKEIVIHAYSLDKPLNEIASPVGYIDTRHLIRFSETNLLPAINAIPGVRMEERSPGSYRFSIRGSLLRSPFGVRNVKVYWNGMPFTDAGGNTYLNLFDVGSIGAIEVIRGPGGSLYGAGTGGVLLLKSPVVTKDKFELSTTFGSYGLQRHHASAQLHHDKYNLSVTYAHQQSEGYRDHTEMQRDALTVEYNFMLLQDKGYASLIFGYTRLFYQTPGGLTRAQYDTLPTQARPRGGPNRGAIEQNAHVLNKTPFFGVAFEQLWNSRWTSKLAVSALVSDFQNPAILNVEERREVNANARLENAFRFDVNERRNKLVFGGEIQQQSSEINVNNNDFGVKGTLQTRDSLFSRLIFAFAQADFELPSSFHVTIGGSFNFLEYEYTHLKPEPRIRQTRKFAPIFSPRIAVLKKVNENFSVYVNAARGYSPPSLAEVRPSTNNYNGSLLSETGTNYEAGARGKLAGIAYDFNAYAFYLDETIVIQRTPDGADYFINAGKTRQEGVELSLAWTPIENQNSLVSDLNFWSSHTYNHYRFESYIQNGVDYTGNKLTGVPPTVSTVGVDGKLRKRIYVNITANYVDHIPLNDANTAYASKYFLLGTRIGFKKAFRNENELDVFFGVDNALDEKYSLGNDLNAFGGRYYNAAAGINFYGGVKVAVK